jgi:hypothetical protein
MLLPNPKLARKQRLCQKLNSSVLLKIRFPKTKQLIKAILSLLWKTNSSIADSNKPFGSSRQMTGWSIQIGLDHFLTILTSSPFSNLSYCLLNDIWVSRPAVVHWVHGTQHPWVADGRTQYIEGSCKQSERGQTADKRWYYNLGVRRRAKVVTIKSRTLQNITHWHQLDLDLWNEASNGKWIWDMKLKMPGKKSR